MSAKIPINKSDSPAEAKPGKDTVYIDVDDDITTVIDKLEAANSKVVALVLPKRAQIFQSIVNMRLLARSADKAGKSPVLITAEAALLPLAGAAGLHVAKNLQSKPAVPEAPGAAPSNLPPPPVPEGADEDELDDKSATLDYHRSIGELAAVHASDDVITLDEDKDELPEPKEPKSSAMSKLKAPKAPKIKVPNFERFRLLLLGGILAVIALIVFIILAIFVLPKATVTIQTASIPVSANLTLDASDKYTSLNESANQIPALLKATKQTSNQQVPATGTQNNGDKATGTVTMSTSDCTGKAPSVSSGTGVSVSGLTYITQQSASFTPKLDSGGNCYYASGSVKITAQAGGTKYNSSINNAAVQGYPGISANGSASGGTDNNTTVVSQTDLDNAKNKITSASSDDFTKKFEKQLSDQGFYVIGSTLKINDPEVTSTPSIGQPASSVSVTINITYTVMVLQKSDLKKVVGDTLNEQIDKSKQRLSTDDVLAGVNVSVQNQSGPAAATLSVTEDTTAVPIIDIAQVKKLAAGHKTADIKAAISEWPGVKDVKVDLSPFWVSKAPKQSKVTVKLQQVKE